MITLHITAPFASFRKSYARSFAESYPLPPPATLYGMLLSLVGERLRSRHAGVRLAFAFTRQPRIATTLHKLSRYKYGVPGKQSQLGNAPDFVETLCGIDLLCHVDSSHETGAGPGLEQRVTKALREPNTVTRTGVLSLGLSDDAVNDISIVERVEGRWRRLLPDDKGQMELPVWVDHVGAKDTRWRRFTLAPEQTLNSPDPADFVQITDPR